MPKEPMAYSELRQILNDLKQVGAELANQQQEAATDIVRSMHDKVEQLHQVALQGQGHYNQLQQQTAQEIAAAVEAIGQQKAQIDETARQMGVLEQDIVGQEAGAAELNRQIGDVQGRLVQAERDWREHQRRLDELNDSSAGSIIRSIFCLGLDRAIMGVRSLVEQDKARANTARDEIRRYQQALMENEAGRNTASAVLSALRAQRGQLEAQSAALSVSKQQLESNEVTLRAQMGFWVDIALFMGKLDVACLSIDNGLSGITDIIGELNDTTPRIADFGGAEGEMLSMAQALGRFEELLENGEAALLSPDGSSALSDSEQSSPKLLQGRGALSVFEDDAPHRRFGPPAWARLPRRIASVKRA